MFELSLFQQPKETLYYFSSYIFNCINPKQLIKQYTYYFIYICCFIFLSYTANCLDLILNVGYWFSLGVMSSIGLGFGMYSVDRSFFYTAVFIIVFVGLICWCIDVLDD